MAYPSAGRPSALVSPERQPVTPPRFALTPARRDVLRVNAIVFLITFIVYWALGPHATPYDFQLSQANNLVHGHLDMTEQYTRNLIILERVLYDGVDFCLPVDDPRAPQSYTDIPNPRITPNCRHYMQHSIGPALLLLPVALVFDIDVTRSASEVQPLASAIIGGLAALFVLAIVRRFTDHRPTQLALTALAIFGTTYWYSAADGGVWHFAHATAVFFLFGAIYATVVRRNALLAGALVGAAFLCRPTTILAGVFPLIALADQWFVVERGTPPWRWLRLGPLFKLALGVAPFVLIAGTFNFLRFSNPFESGYSYSEEFHQLSLIGQWPYGIADLRYIPRHVAVFFEQMPIVVDRGSFVWPSWAGLAMWVTTPAILTTLFIHLRRHREIAITGAVALAAACAFILAGAAIRGLDDPFWGRELEATGIQLVPFWLLLGGALAAAVAGRDRLVLAAWAAVLAIGLLNWTFSATGWAQFGYRYGLDFMPFLFLLIVIAVGRQARWYHYALIVAGIVVNLWGVLWIFQFARVPPDGLFGWTWVSF